MKAKEKEQKNSNVLSYKGYYGSVEFSLEDNCLFGSLTGLESGAMTYEGTTLEELKASFEETVDMYLEHCQESNIQPKKPFSGMFGVRIKPLLHQRIAFRAKEEGISINRFINRALEHELHLDVAH